MGNSNAINVLLTAYFLFLLFLLVSLYVADVLDVGKTQNDHQVVNEFDFYAVVEQDR